MKKVHFAHRTAATGTVFSNVLEFGDSQTRSTAFTSESPAALGAVPTEESLICQQEAGRSQGLTPCGRSCGQLRLPEGILSSRQPRIQGQPWGCGCGDAGSRQSLGTPRRPGTCPLSSHLQAPRGVPGVWSLERGPGSPHGARSPSQARRGRPWGDGGHRWERGQQLLPRDAAVGGLSQGGLQGLSCAPLLWLLVTQDDRPRKFIVSILGS